MEEDCGEGQGLSWAVEPRRERDRSVVSENRELRETAEPKREKMAEDWTGLHNEELHKHILRQISLGWSNQGG
jgi:hypothetical protein